MHILKRLIAGLIVAASLTVPSFAANSIYDLLTTEPSNSTSGGWNAAENQAPSTVNDGIRAGKQLIAAWLDDLGAVNTVAGTSTAITTTLTQGFTAYGTGAGQIGNGTIIAIKTGSAATGATTINVNTIGAKAIRRQGDFAVDVGDWPANAVILLRYDTTYNSAAGAWVLLNAASGATTSAADIITTLTSTDAGTARGPTVEVFRDSASPAADAIGAVEFHGRTSAGAKRLYAELSTSILDATNATYRGYASLVAWSAAGGLTGISISAGNASQALVEITGRIDVLTGQLSLPATQNPSSNANTLDDYEEGTWTPSPTGFTIVNGTGGVAWSGTYTKIGRLVKVTMLATITGTATIASAGGGTTFISNLPFSATAADTLTVSGPGLPNYPIGNIQSGSAFMPAWSAVNSTLWMSATYTAAT